MGRTVEDALNILGELGLEVVLKEIRSKKGVCDGNETRIVRQRSTGHNAVELAFCVFKTIPCTADETSTEGA